MYSLKIQAEKAIDTRTIKVMVDGEERGRTEKQIVNVMGYESDDEVYLRALLLKTNKLKCPKKNGVYCLTWKQNYIPVIVFIAIIFLLFMPLANDGYEASERLIVLGLGVLLVKLLWNDLLIFGRKIRINKEEF